MTASTVTGRTYKRTRARGFIEWKPQAQTRELVAQIEGVLDAYRPQLPMTARQVFYVLVGQHGYDKTEPAYTRLCETLVKARRAGMIPFGSIRDDGQTSSSPWAYDDPADFWRGVQLDARTYSRHLLQRQAVHLELWCEASGMVPQAARIAHGYGITVYSDGGFGSVTSRYEAAARMARRDVPTVVLHVGDHDPSGCSIIDSAAEDVTAFAQAVDDAPMVTFERVAVTPEQIEVYDLTTAPQKSTDRRGEQMAETVQAEALTPTQLAYVIREAIETRLDLDVMDEVRALALTERRAIAARIAEVDR